MCYVQNGKSTINPTNTHPIFMTLHTEGGADYHPLIPWQEVEIQDGELQTGTWP